MTILVKNKHTLQIDEFQFRCCIGKNGIKKIKFEGDKSTPAGLFRLLNLYYRPDRIDNLNCKINKIKIKKNMGWCDDPESKKYNQLIKINSEKKFEKLYRKDHKYDLLIELDFNRVKRIPNKGSAIFLHLTNNYKPTAGCVAIKKKDFLILLKIIKKNTYLKIN